MADAVFAHVRKSKSFQRDYFGALRTNDARDSVTLVSEDPGNSLTVNIQDVIFTKDSYETGRPVNLEKAAKEFAELWGVVDSILHVKAIRRIGIVGETRIEDVDSPSLLLLQSLTTLQNPNHSAKFRLHYEERLPTLEGLAPDIESDDFKNIIYSFYDSSLDSVHAEDNAVSFTLDFQRYYTPPISRDILKQVEKLSPEFESKWNSFSDHLTKLGISDS